MKRRATRPADLTGDNPEQRRLAYEEWQKSARARGDYHPPREDPFDMDLTPARDDYGFKDTNCVFCPINWDKLNLVEGQGDINTARTVLVHPLKPVTEGHVLAIHRRHTTDAAEDPAVTADVMSLAAWHVKARKIQANIITSVGVLATQSVMHLHIHIVPRTENDDLPLPWTPQQMEEARWKEALEANILHRMAARAKASGERYDREQAEKLKSPFPHHHGGLRP